jgi:uncharacterized protein YuzE
MRLTYDRGADAACIYLTEELLMPGRDSVQVELPEGVQAMVVLDCKDGEVAGLKLLDASALLHADPLATRSVPSSRIQGLRRTRTPDRGISGHFFAVAPTHQSESRSRPSRLSKR